MNLCRGLTGLVAAAVAAACAAPAVVPHVPAPPAARPGLPVAAVVTAAEPSQQHTVPAVPAGRSAPVVMRMSLAAARVLEPIAPAPSAADSPADGDGAWAGSRGADPGVAPGAPATSAGQVRRRSGFRGPVVVPVVWGVPDPLGYGIARAAARHATPRLVRDLLLGPWSWLHRAWR